MYQSQDLSNNHIKHHLEQVTDLVVEKLRTLDFERIWPGFHLYPFALYDDEYVFLHGKLLKWTPEFNAATVIEHESEMIAIWPLSDNDTDIDVLTANICHEMFHAYQRERGEQRCGDLFVGLAYRYVYDNLRLKNEEMAMLAEALEEALKGSSADIQHMQSLLGTIYRLREQRKERFADEVTYEYGMESMEGAAEYVGLKTLEQLAPDTLTARLRSIHGSLKSEEYLFDIPRLNYLIGSTVLYLADNIGFAPNDTIENNTVSITEDVLERMHIQSAAEVHDHTESTENAKTDLQLQTQIEEFLQSRKTVVETFKEEAKNHMEMEACLQGFDPMNMMKVENYILHHRFVNIDGRDYFHPVLTQMKSKDSFFEVCAIYY